MKNIYIIILFALSTKTVFGQNQDVALWKFRMSQSAYEFQTCLILGGKMNDSAGYKLLTENDTVKYKSGQIYRTCEVNNGKLNGYYKMYYPNGQLYVLSTYKNNLLSDSSMVYNSHGQMEYIIKYFSPFLEQKIYLDTNNKIKRIDNITVEDSSHEVTALENVNFELIDSVTSDTRSIKSEYYNSEGEIIKRKEYFKLYPEEKNK
jgi:antitoxin component YwqK of YwqJK toxin-antitoxin module